MVMTSNRADVEMITMMVGGDGDGDDGGGDAHNDK